MPVMRRRELRYGRGSCATKRPQDKMWAFESLVTDSDIRNVATGLRSALPSPISAHFVRHRDTKVWAWRQFS
jgi:hypothetical protein